MKKIMFNDKFGLTKSVLEGRKTQTRRIITDPDSTLIGIRRQILVLVHKIKNKEEINKDLSEFGSCYSPYKEGEIIAIAQSYKNCGRFDVYEAQKDTPGWTNKMFVRADLMPHRIKIERIRVERLQEISDEDCKREGIVEAYRGCYWLDGFYHTGTLPQIVYRELIDKISGKGTWDKNPFVFVYDFKLID